MHDWYDANKTEHSIFVYVSSAALDLVKEKETCAANWTQGRPTDILQHTHNVCNTELLSII